jgi:FAD:protein FMN transferase
MLRHAENVMGTVVSFALCPGDVPAADLDAALRDACAVLHAADATFSTYRPDSPLSLLRRHGDLRTDDPDILEVLGWCARAEELTGGWFDAWAMPGGVDPTGLVKGWAAQRAADTLRAAGVPAAMVNAAGDVAGYGRPAGRTWRVGLSDPRDPSRLLGVVCDHPAVATSGRWERGDHVLDPVSGGPARGALSATVTGPDLTLADALATALVACGPDGLDWLADVDGYEGVVMAPDARLSTTAGFALGR